MTSLLADLSADDIALAHSKGIISDRELILIANTLERERCLSDLFYLAHDVLGYADLTESIHRPLCSLVSSVNPLIMSLAAGKSYQSKPYQSLARNAVNVSPVEAHADNLAKWFGYISRENLTSGVGGGGVSLLTSSQNSIKNFTLPNTNSINKLIAQEIIQFNPEARTRLFLLFRGAFKSTIITIAHTIQLMLLWPDIRILIASHKKEGGSQKFLSSIKDHFIRNDRFRKLFPEFCPKANATGQIDWGTSEQVTLPNRSTKAIYPEATIEIAGNTTDVTGRHYNYLKIDDIVTRESVTNEAMLERTEEFNALLTFLFDQPEWGLADYAGTCYHFSDLYAQLRNSSQITKFILPIWDENKTPTIPERFTKEGIEAIRNHPSQTSYQFSCNPYEAPIWMVDGSFKPIGEVKVGDEVIGFNGYIKGKRKKLIKTKVLFIGTRNSNINTITLDNGDKIRCTPDHQWYTGRVNDKFHKEYRIPDVGSRLIKAINIPERVLTREEIYDWAYLSAMIDGEGSCGHGSIAIHQSLEKNPEICKRIEEVLNRLNLRYTIHSIKEHGIHKSAKQFVIQSDRQTRINILAYANPAKRFQIMNVFFKKGADFCGDKPKVLDIKHVGYEPVYSMQTESGNYICWGYASKNCQYLLNPVPTDDQTFRPEYWQKAGFYYDKLPQDLKVYVLVDPANKQRKESDYTALMTIGMDTSGDLWLIDIIRDKLTLDGRAKLVADTLIKHGIHTVHYESVGFQSSDIKAIKEMGSQRDWNIVVNEIKASRQSKEDRIRGLQYFYEQGKVHWPKKYAYFSKYHNRSYDMVEVLRREMWMFPSCEKDDLCDVHSFILRSSMIKASTMKEQKTDDMFERLQKMVKDAKKPRTHGFNGSGRGGYEIPSQKSFR